MMSFAEVPMDMLDLVIGQFFDMLAQTFDIPDILFLVKWIARVCCEFDVKIFLWSVHHEQQPVRVTLIQAVFEEFVQFSADTIGAGFSGDLDGNALFLITQIDGRMIFMLVVQIDQAAVQYDTQYLAVKIFSFPVPMEVIIAGIYFGVVRKSNEPFLDLVELCRSGHLSTFFLC